MYETELAFPQTKRILKECCSFCEYFLFSLKSEIKTKGQQVMFFADEDKICSLLIPESQPRGSRTRSHFSYYHFKFYLSFVC